ncbi:hypothetical protein CW703_02190 [Candidatus Bathyarchaeota archaeon]|nr:MAG: hypothetical protein CW703_02190 [Candidatus Bathyarchaeota archaeon]
MVKINVLKFGKVEEVVVKKILEIINDTYNQIKQSKIEIVDLHIFEKSSTMNLFMVEEKRKLGILTSNFEESYFATHDAWYGIPRIFLCLEKIKEKPWMVVVGGLRHEVAHTILHGSPEYYILTLPKAFKKLNLPLKILENLTYLVSVAVKDYEVTRLLYNEGFVEDQVAYCKYFLKPTIEDLKDWETAKLNPLTKIIFLTAYIKNLCCATPLLKDKNFGLEIEKAINESLIFLPKEIASKIFRVIKATEKFGLDTHQNIEILSVEIVKNFIVKPNG